MPGLISSKEYEASKRAFCSETRGGVEDAIDALEWQLVNAASIDAFQLVRSSSSVRYASIEATAHTPTMVIIFTIEVHAGEDKCLLIDIFRAEDDEND